MTDAAALLAAVRQAPNDDAPRLVYADWLDEHGQPERAEFIRVQCQLAAIPKYDSRSQPLKAREQDLIRRHGTEWAGDIAAIARDHEFHRGFIEAAAVGARKFLSHGEKLFSLAPICHLKLLRLGSSNVSAAELADSTVLSRVRSLALQGYLDGDGLHALLSSSALRNLTALTLEGNFDGDGLEPLWKGCLPDLESLDFNSDYKICTDASLSKLLASRWASRLKRLNLQYHNLKVEGGQAIASSRTLTGLTSLGLRHCSVGLGGTRALAESPNLGDLRLLDLRNNRLTDSGMRAICSSSRLPALTELYLGMNDIGPNGARALADWPGLARLRVLHLYSCPIGDDGAIAIAALPYAAGLRHLDLTLTGMSDRGTRVVAESPCLKQTQVGSFKPEWGVAFPSA
jgi:uncharacterized protein (TIGR02996 family)